MKTQRKSSINLCITGLLAAMITLMTAFILHIPYGANGGYIHVGDALIYISAVILPKPYAIAAAAIGGGLADLLTAPMWFPATVIIKPLLVLAFTNESVTLFNRRNCVATVIAGIISIAGYYLAEGLLFGSFIAPLASISGNLIQAVGSAIIFFVLAPILKRIISQAFSLK